MGNIRPQKLYFLAHKKQNKFNKEKIKKIIKPFLVVIIAGFVVSVLYISLANRDIEKELKKGVKLPEISGYDYSDLENRISDLEDKADDLESRIDALGTVPKGGAVPSLIY